jgi:hypothetical protein
VGGQSHAPAALPPGKTRYPLYRRVGGLQGWSGRVREISPPTGIRSPDRPTRSEPLYRLSYPGPTTLAADETDCVWVWQKDGVPQVERRRFYCVACIYSFVKTDPLELRFLTGGHAPLTARDF